MVVCSDLAPMSELRLLVGDRGIELLELLARFGMRLAGGAHLTHRRRPLGEEGADRLDRRGPRNFLGWHGLLVYHLGCAGRGSRGGMLQELGDTRRIGRRTRVLGRIGHCGSLERIDLVSSGRGRIRGRRIDVGSALQDAVLLVFHVINLGIEIVNHRSLPCRS